MAREAPQPQDVLDFQFKLQCRLKVFKNESCGEFGKVCNLIATANRFGLVFVGTVSKQFQVIRIEDIEELEKDVTAYPCRVIEIPSKPRHLSVNCDGTKLCVVVERDECPTAIFYDVLSFLKEQVTVVKEIRLSATPRVDVIQTEWNPAVPNVFTACKSDGLLGVYEFKDATLEIKELPAGAAATCFCWSPKGKQLAVGSKDGKITQYKPDLKAVKVVNPPPLEGSPGIVSLMWASSFQFMGIYKQANSAALIVIDAPKTGETVYTNYDDICYSYGDARPLQFYMILEQHWNVLMVASSNSMEIGVLGNETNKWLQWILGDSSRAELPLSKSKQDTFPIGLALNTSTTRDVASREKTQTPTSPMLLMMSHQGQLCCFYAVNSKKGVASACSPMETVAYAQNLFKKVDGKQEPLVSLSSAPKPLLPTPTLQQPVVIIPTQQPVANIQSQQPVANIQSPQSVVSMQSQQSMVNQLLQQPVVNKPLQQPVVNKPLLQQPAVNIQTQQTFFGGGLASQTPQFATKPLATNLFGNAVPPSQPTTNFNLNTQPVSNIFGANTKPAQPAKTIAQPTAKIPTTPPAVTETAEPVKTPTKRGQDGKLIPNKETEGMIAELIREECLTLDAEIKALLHSCREISVNVGSDSEATQMVQQCNALQEFLQALKETSSGQTAEIHTLKQTVIQTWAWYEEARSRFNTSQDPVLMKVMQGRPLDPASQQQLEDINHSTYYLDSQLLQANKSLDDQWEVFQDSLSKNKKVQLPTMEAIYQSMVRQNATLQKQRYVLKDISSRVQSHRRHQSSVSSILISLEKVDDLQDELENLKLYPEESTPQIRYKKILERQKKLTKDKCDKLFRFFSKREVTRVSVVKPQLNNTTVQLTTLLAAPLSPIVLEKKAQPVKKVDFVMSTPKPQAHQGKNLTVIFDKNKGICPTSTPSIKLKEAEREGNAVKFNTASNPGQNFALGVKSAATPIFSGANKNVTFTVKTNVSQPAPTPTTVVSKSTFSFTSLTSTSSIDSNKGISGFATLADGNKFGSQAQMPMGLIITPVAKTSVADVTSTTLGAVNLKTPSTASSPIFATNAPLFGKSALPATSLPKLGGSNLINTTGVGSSSVFGQKSASAALILASPSAKSSTAAATTSPFNLNSNTPVFNITSTNTSSAAAVATSPFNVKTMSSTANTPGFNAVSTVADSPFSLSTSGNLFGSGGSVFGSTTAPSTTTATTTTAGIFGSATATSTTVSLFGASTTGGLFSTTGKIFGTASTPISSSNIFGTASMPSSTTTPATTAGSFESTKAGSFGATAPSSTAGVFATTAPSSTAGVFASTAAGVLGITQPSTTAGPTVPSSSSTPAGLFGAASTAGVFGTIQPSMTTGATALSTTASVSAPSTTTSAVVSTAVPASSTAGVFGDETATNTKSTSAVTTAGIFGGSKSVFGGGSTTGSLTSMSSISTFGSASTASVPSNESASSTVVFGSAAPSSTSIFGTTAATTTAASPFAAVSSSVFGSAPTTSATSAPASTPTTLATSVFGGQPATAASALASTTATSATSVFEGQTATATSALASTTAASLTSVFVGQPATAASALASTPATSATTGFGGHPASPLFGSTTTTSATSLFGGQSATAASAFGSTTATTTQSAFPGFSTPTTAATVFGAAATTTTGAFGAATTASSFGSPFTTQATSAFGSGEAKSPFAAASANLFSGFGTQSTASGPVFGQPAAFANTAGSGSIFGGGANTATSSVFGSGSTTNTFGSNPSVFGTATTAASPFRGSSAFGTSTNTNSPFGATAASTAPSPFAQAASTFGSAPTFGSGGGAFGLNSLNVGNTTTASGFGAFGQAAQNPFGRSTTSSTSGSVFGTPATTTSASIFGTPTTSSSSVFGAASPFNKPAAPAFGSPPTFGQSPAFGQSAFGQTSTFGGSPGFGSGGAFSGGGQAIQQGGFGSPAFQKPAAGGFGSAPVFGSPTPGFGSPPSFGGAPTFGGGGTFGSPQKVFGTPTTESSFGNVAQSPTFGNLANQNTLGFGNLAQQAASPPAPQSNSFSGGSSFSSWR